jgi:hypothetical protein
MQETPAALHERLLRSLPRAHARMPLSPRQAKALRCGSLPISAATATMRRSGHTPSAQLHPTGLFVMYDPTTGQPIQPSHFIQAQAPYPFTCPTPEPPHGTIPATPLGTQSPSHCKPDLHAKSLHTDIISSPPSLRPIRTRALSRRAQAPSQQRKESPALDVSPLSYVSDFSDLLENAASTVCGSPRLHSMFSAAHSSPMQGTKLDNVVNPITVANATHCPPPDAEAVGSSTPAHPRPVDGGEPSEMAARIACSSERQRIAELGDISLSTSSQHIGCDTMGLQSAHSNSHHEVSLNPSPELSSQCVSMEAPTPDPSGVSRDVGPESALHGGKRPAQHTLNQCGRHQTATAVNTVVNAAVGRASLTCDDGVNTKVPAPAAQLTDSTELQDLANEGGSSQTSPDAAAPEQAGSFGVVDEPHGLHLVSLQDNNEIQRSSALVCRIFHSGCDR